MIAAMLGAAWCHAASLPVIAIRNATVHPASGPAIERATVVVRNGLIESVGAVLRRRQMHGWWSRRAFMFTLA
jgi:hypothetical protein